MSILRDFIQKINKFKTGVSNSTRFLFYLFSLSPHIQGSKPNAFRREVFSSFYYFSETSIIYVVYLFTIFFFYPRLDGCPYIFSNFHSEIQRVFNIGNACEISWGFSLGSIPWTGKNSYGISGKFNPCRLFLCSGPLLSFYILPPWKNNYR